LRGASRAWLCAAVCGVAVWIAACGTRSALPEAQSDREFWNLIEALSEPAGALVISDNLA